MSCVAMSMAGSGFHIRGDTITPGTLNAWLQQNHGYHCDSGDCNNLVLNAPDHLSEGRFRFIGEWNTSYISLSAIEAGLTTGEVAFMGHLSAIPHFVLLSEYVRSNDSFAVLDPYFNKTHYARDEFSDFIQYEVLPADSKVPRPYPLFKQCDPQWADDVITIKTVCDVGCLMSSTAMALREHGISIDGEPSSPGALNRWLKANGGYVNGTDDFEESALVKLDPKRIKWTNESMRTHNDLSWDQVTAKLEAGDPVIANVMSGHHFVLVVGFDEDGDTLYINDPGFNRQSYSHSKDVVGYRLFLMDDTRT